MYITAVYRQYSLLKNLYNFLKWVFSVACSAGFASCKTFGKQPKHPCFGRSPKRGEGGSPTFSPFPGERGLGIGIKNKHFFGTTDFSTNKIAPDHISRERFSVFDLFMPVHSPAHQSVPRLHHSAHR